jgi:hypothetical protein
VIQCVTSSSMGCDSVPCFNKPAISADDDPPAANAETATRIQHAHMDTTAQITSQRERVPCHTTTTRVPMCRVRHTTLRATHLRNRHPRPHRPQPLRPPPRPPLRSLQLLPTTPKECHAPHQGRQPLPSLLHRQKLTETQTSPHRKRPCSHQTGTTSTHVTRPPWHHRRLRPRPCACRRDFVQRTRRWWPWSSFGLRALSQSGMTDSPLLPRVRHQICAPSSGCCRC